MYTVVLDTNILISAIVFGGKPREILRKIISGKIRLAISQDILDEVVAVLSGNKFKYPSKVAHEIRNAIEELGELFVSGKRINIVKKDPDDNRILECALAADAEFIISGDKHLLELMKYKNTQIISPAAFLDKF
ncbi:MAG: putative toxin-antitoxin system toxin component, PIN family [Desulfobacteraceae bacterium]|jgi:putative PIN family toxin of toxin-antitoxin system